MSRTGIVSAVFDANEPGSKKPIREIIIDLVDGTRVSFFIPEGNDPPIGLDISWGPHYAWDQSGRWRVHKLSTEIDPDGLPSLT